MARLDIDGGRVLSDLEALRRIGGLDRAVDRPALGVADLEAREWVGARLEAAGLAVAIDGVANVFGRTPGATRYLIIGSHTDTVPDGGWLDGSLGVVYGLEIARAWMEAGGSGDVGIEVANFSDEEGTFRPLLGSSAFTGTISSDVALASCRPDGASVAQVLAETPYADRPIARLDPETHVGFLEAHIEQGPVLDSGQEQVGIVEAIAGLTRVQVTYFGQADHAGTTPMAMRRDASQAAITLAALIPAIARRHGSENTLWNVGDLSVRPGSYNVVPGEARVLIEYRDTDRAVLDKLTTATRLEAQAFGTARGLSVDVVHAGTTSPATLDSSLTATLEQAAHEVGARYLFMRSGAGHDAMALAQHLPTALLFVPSIGGRSHHPDEDTDAEDIVLGARVMARAVEMTLASSG